MELYLLICFLTPALTQKVLNVDIEPKQHVNSYGMTTLYGNRESAGFFQIVSTMQDSPLLRQVKATKGMPKPLKSEDVKCVMSVDKYCSKDMLRTKNLMISAIVSDCKECSKEDKVKVGKVIAALMTYESVAWKLFLMRTAVVAMPQAHEHRIKAISNENLKRIGQPELMPESKKRFLLPDFSVKIERYTVAVKNTKLN